MPINADQNTDKNTQGYSLPVDSCVGDSGPTPEQVALDVPGGTQVTAAEMGSPTGGSITAGGSRGKAIAQTDATPPVGFTYP